MRREFKVEANIGKPQVAYRETIRTKVEQLRLHPQEADRWLRPVRQGQIAIEPTGAGDGGYEFENKVTGGRIPQGVHPVGRRGCQEAMEFGVLAGYPMVDVKVTLLDGALPRRRLVRDRLQDRRLDGVQGGRPQGRPGPARADDGRRGPTPEDYMGDVIGDLNSRRGQIQAMEERSGARVVRALVPLSEMFGYVGDLRSKTQGRANYTMQFDSYAEVPATWRKRSSRRPAASSTEPGGTSIHPADQSRPDKYGEQPQVLGGPQWRRRSSSGPSRTSTSARSVTSTTARRR